jgi:hypothetical protein
MVKIVIYLELLRWACDGELLHLVRDSFHYPLEILYGSSWRGQFSHSRWG